MIHHLRIKQPENEIKEDFKQSCVYGDLMEGRWVGWKGDKERRV